MKTRSNYELLIILRDNMHMFEWGLCMLTAKLGDLSIINKDEEEKLIHYIDKNRPRRMEFMYGWTPGEISPRLEWLNDNIRQLRK